MIFQLTLSVLYFYQAFRSVMENIIQNKLKFIFTFFLSRHTRHFYTQYFTSKFDKVSQNSDSISTEFSTKTQSEIRQIRTIRINWVQISVNCNLKILLTFLVKNTKIFHLFCPWSTLMTTIFFLTTWFIFIFVCFQIVLFCMFSNSWTNSWIFLIWCNTKKQKEFLSNSNLVNSPKINHMCGPRTSCFIYRHMTK